MHHFSDWCFFYFPANGVRPADAHPHERGRRAAARQTPAQRGRGTQPPERRAAAREPPLGEERARPEGAAPAGRQGSPGRSGHERPPSARLDGRAGSARGPARSPQRTGGARRASTGALRRAKAGGMPPTSARRASAPEDGNARADVRPRPRGSRPQGRKKSRPQGRAACEPTTEAPGTGAAATRGGRNGAPTRDVRPPRRSRPLCWVICGLAAALVVQGQTSSVALRARPAAGCSCATAHPPEGFGHRQS